jgi:hypothetical protein
MLQVYIPAGLIPNALPPLSKDFNEDQPRDTAGRWTIGDNESYDLTAELGSRHNPIHCGTDIDKAAKLISEGKHVTLNQPDQIATLIDKIRVEGNAARDAGRPIPDWNLANISVPGTNLFAVNNLGIPRVEMPQFSGQVVPGSRAAARLPQDAPANSKVDLTTEFIDKLKENNVKVTTGHEFASHLRATQDELNGFKIAEKVKQLEDGTARDRAVFITKDNYVVDGHHMWAAQIIRDIKQPSKDFKVPVVRVNIDIGRALTLGREFQADWGLKRQLISLFAPGLVAALRKYADVHLPSEKKTSTPIVKFGSLAAFVPSLPFDGTFDPTDYNHLVKPGDHPWNVGERPGTATPKKKFNVGDKVSIKRTDFGGGEGYIAEGPDRTTLGPLQQIVDEQGNKIGIFHEIFLTPIAKAVDVAGNVTHSYGIVQINIPENSNVFEALMALATSIPDSELAGEGRTIEPHVTLRYGIMPDVKKYVETEARDVSGKWTSNGIDSHILSAETWGNKEFSEKQYGKPLSSFDGINHSGWVTDNKIWLPVSDVHADAALEYGLSNLPSTTHFQTINEDAFDKGSVRVHPSNYAFMLEGNRSSIELIRDIIPHAPTGSIEIELHQPGVSNTVTGRFSTAGDADEWLSHGAKNNVTKAYDDTEERDARGEWTTSGGESRSEISTENYVTSTKKAQHIADNAEKNVARYLGFDRSSDNKPFDVTGKNDAGKKVAVEVKTIQHAKADRIPMRRDSRLRKEEAAKNFSRVFTLGIDKRGSRDVYYVKQGVGAFNLHTMSKYTSMIDVAQAIKGA